MTEAQAFLRLKTAALSVIVQLQESRPDSTLPVTLKRHVDELQEAVVGTNRQDLLDSLPIVTLPLYTIITTPPPHSRPGKFPEVEIVAAALQCVERTMQQCGSNAIDVDPSIYLKFFTHLALRLATLSTEDSSRSVEWSTEEKAVISTLRALCECRGPLVGASHIGSSQSSRPDGGEAAAAAGEDASSTPESWDNRERWTEVLRALMKALNGAIVAQSVQALLDVAAKDKDREMRLLALSTLSSLVHLLFCPDVWRPFFPGVFGGLTKIVVGDFKQGSKVTAAALRIALHVTALLTSDEAIQPPTTTNTTTSPSAATSGAWQAICARFSPSSSSQRPEPAIATISLAVPSKLAIPVTDAWVNDLRQRLSEFMPLLLRAARDNPSARVRHDLLEGLALLLRSSPRFLKDSDILLRDVIDTVVGLQRDEVQDIAKAAATLAPCSVLPAADESWVLQRLVDLFTVLPKVVVSANDRPLRSTLDLLAAYVTLLTARPHGGMHQLLSTEMDLVTTTLTQALTFDRSLNLQVIDPLIIPSPQQQQASTSSRPVNAGYYRSSFQHLRDQRCIMAAKEVLGLLGGRAGGDGVYLLVDDLLRRLKARRKRGGPSRLDWAMGRLPIVYALNHIILGAAGTPPASLLPAIRLLLEDLLGTTSGASVWRLPTCQGEEEGEGGEDTMMMTVEGEGAEEEDGGRPSRRVPLSAEVLDANGLLAALLVEGVGNCAQALGAEAFQPLLMLVLYPLLEKMGHGHPVVRQAALTTFYRLAVITGTGSIRGLIARNLDYLVDSLCSRVRRSRGKRGGGGAFPVKAGVLECLMTYTGGEEGQQLQWQGSGVAMSLMKEMATLTLSVVDVEGRVGAGPRYVNGMMRVLHAMVRNVAVATEEKEEEEQGGGKKRRKRRTVEKAYRADAATFWRQQILKDFAVMKGPQEDAGEEGPGTTPTEYFTKLHEGKKKKGEKAHDYGDDDEDEDDDGKLEVDKLLKRIKAVSGEVDEDALAMEEEEEEGREGEQEEEDDKPTESEALIIDILERCAYFVACPSLLVQHTVLSVMAEALGKLRGRRFVLLPTVHKVWPALFSRLRKCVTILQPHKRPGINEEHTPDSDRSTATFVLIKTLDMISCLAALCGDYMSLKFTEELWPLLHRLLASYQARRPKAMLTADRIRSIAAPPSSSSSSLLLQGMNGASRGDGGGGSGGAMVEVGSDGRAAAAAGAGGSRLETRGLVAVVHCLSSFCCSEDCYMYTTPLVHDMGVSCLFLLGRHDDPTLRDETTRLFDALIHLDGASLWPALMALAGCDVSVRPMRWSAPLSSSSSPAMGHFDVPGLKKGALVWNSRKERRLVQERAGAMVDMMHKAPWGEVAWCMSSHGC